MNMRLDFADVKPTMLNFAVVTLMASMGIVFAKYVTARFIPNSPLADFFGAV